MPSGFWCVTAWMAASGFAAGLMLFACSSEEQQAGPRSGGGNAGATSGGVGAAGGGDGGAGGSKPPPNLCECSAALGVEPECNDCFNDNTATDTPCEAEADACIADAGCNIIRFCVQDCDDSDCKQACILPFDADPSHALWRDVLECLCVPCAAVCSSSQPLECDEGNGGGGSGGGSGSGGGGGSGGMR